MRSNRSDSLCLSLLVASQSHHVSKSLSNTKKLFLIIVVILFNYINSFAQIAVLGDTIYTMAGEKIVNGVVLINVGKIEKVGSQNEISVPSGYKTVKGKVVTPGLIDAHSVVGLSG